MTRNTHTQVITTGIINAHENTFPSKPIKSLSLPHPLPTPCSSDNTGVPKQCHFNSQREKN